MMRCARRQYLIRSVAALGGVLAAACFLTESLWPGTGPPPRRAAPATLRVLYGPWTGAMYTERPVGWSRPDGQPDTPDREWFHTTAVAAFKERYPDGAVSFESHHDPLNRALELHRAGTVPDVFQTDDLRNADLIRRRLAHRLDGWIKQLPHADDFVRPALLAGQTEGVQWGLPFFSRVYTLYFNRHVLRAVGIGQPPTTWGALLDTAHRSTLVGDGELVRAGLPAPHSRWFWWLLQLTGVTLYDGGQVAALENEAEVVLTLLRDLDAAVQPSGVVTLERDQYIEPSSVDSGHWYLGKAAHAWVPDLPPQHDEFLQRHSWNPSSPPPPEAAPQQQATLSPDLRTAVATAEVEQRRAALSGPLPAAAGQPTPESTLIGQPPVPGSTRYALPGARAAPLVHAHTAVLHVSAQSAAPDNAWELLTTLLEPETLHSYTHLRWAVPPRKSILGRGYLQSGNTQQMVDLWLRYGRPPFDPPRYDQVSQAIEATFQAVVVRKLVAQLEKIVRAITPPYTGTTRR